MPSEPHHTDTTPAEPQAEAMEADGVIATARAEIDALRHPKERSHE